MAQCQQVAKPIFVPKIRPFVTPPVGLRSSPNGVVHVKTKLSTWRKAFMHLGKVDSELLARSARAKVYILEYNKRLRVTLTMRNRFGNFNSIRVTHGFHSMIFGFQDVIFTVGGFEKYLLGWPHLSILKCLRPRLQQIHRHFLSSR